MSDVTSAGSGVIISAIERTQIGTNQTNITNNTNSLGTKLSTSSIPNVAGDISGDYSSGLTIDAGVITSTQIANATITGADLATNIAISTTGIIETSSEYKYSADKTRYLSVPSAAFTIAGGQSGMSGVIIQGDNAQRHVLGGDPTKIVSLTAPVFLPHNAKVTGFEVYVYDNDGTNDFKSIKLETYDLGGTASAQAVATAPDSSGSSTSKQILTAGTIVSTYSTVDNINNVYYVSLSTYQNNSNLRTYGAIITYTVTSAD